MNREIKFRAWHKGYSGKGKLKAIQPRMLFDDKPGDCLVFLNDGQPVEVMQYIGLKDKNYKEIYEGDICRILYTDWPSNTDPDIPLEDYLISISHVGEVVYEAPYFAILFQKKSGGVSLGSFNYAPHGRIEVIGNIYEKEKP